PFADHQDVSVAPVLQQGVQCLDQRHAAFTAVEEAKIGNDQIVLAIAALRSPRRSRCFVEYLPANVAAYGDLDKPPGLAGQPAEIGRIGGYGQIDSRGRQFGDPSPQGGAGLGEKIRYQEIMVGPGYVESPLPPKSR